VGFNVGLKVLRYLAPFADVETGLYFTTKGYTTENATIVGENQLTLGVTNTFKYVQVPAMIRLAVPKAKIKPFANGGFYLAFLTGSEREDAADWDLGPQGTGSSSRAYDIPGAQSFDAGFHVGGGVEWRFTDKASFIAEVGYERGLTDPVDETKAAKTSQKLLLPDEFKDVGVDTAASAENKAQTHSVFQVNVGIAMHF
jgi:hypothetical protein